LVLFVRIGTFQWVTAIPNKKFSLSVSGSATTVSGELLSVLHTSQSLLGPSKRP
jgi:hypothetical protein